MRSSSVFLLLLACNEPAGRTGTAGHAGAASASAMSFASPAPTPTSAPVSAPEWAQGWGEITALSVQGEVAAIGLDDGRVELWNVRAGSFERGFRAASRAVTALTHSPAGTRLLVADEGGDLTLWELEPLRVLASAELGQPVRQLRYVPGSADVFALAPGAELEIELAAADLGVQGRSETSKEPLATLQDPVTEAVLRFARSSPWATATTSSGATAWALKGRRWPKAAALHQTLPLFATTATVHPVEIRALKDGKIVQTLPRATGDARALAFDARGETLFVQEASGAIQAFDTTRWQATLRYDAAPVPDFRAGSSFLHAGEHELVATLPGGVLQSFGLHREGQTHVMTRRRASFVAGAFGAALEAAMLDERGELLWFDADARALRSLAPATGERAWAREKPTLVLESGAATELRLAGAGGFHAWRAPPSDEARELAPRQGRCTGRAALAGDRPLCAGPDGVRLWSGKSWRALKAPANAGSVVAMAASAQAVLVAYAAGVVELWQPEARRPSWSLRLDQPRLLALADDGQAVAVVHDAARLSLLSARTGQVLRSLSLPGRQTNAGQLVYSHRSQRVLLAGASGAEWLDVASGSWQTLTDEAIVAAAVSSEGHLTALSATGALRYWSLAGELWLELQFFRNRQWVARSRDGEVWTSERGESALQRSVPGPHAPSVALTASELPTPVRSLREALRARGAGERSVGSPP